MILVYEEILELVNSGAYGGARFLSPSSEAILMSAYAGYAEFRWRQSNGEPLTQAQKDIVDNWIANVQYEVWFPHMLGQVIWSMVNPANAPSNLLLADGSIISDYDYPALAEALGSEWLVSPSPPGVIQFKLPNLIGAYASGASSGNMQTRVGANNVTLTTGQMPSHSHSYTRPFVQPVTYTPGPGPATFVTAFNGSTSSSGGNQSHENRPLTQRLYPYVVAR